MILNQFSEYGNHLVHWAVTGRALERVVESLTEQTAGRCGRPPSSRRPGPPGRSGRATGSRSATARKIAAVEALECPTMLRNGFGEHNIQGIGDKHIPLIHNVMNTDLVVDISDRATDRLLVLLNTDAGRAYLAVARRA